MEQEKGTGKKTTSRKKQPSKKAASSKKKATSKSKVKMLNQIVESENQRTIFEQQIITFYTKKEGKVSSRAQKEIIKYLNGLSLEELKETRDELEKGL